MEVNKRNHFSVPSIGAVRNVLRDLMRLSVNSKGKVFFFPPSKSLQTYISTQPKKQNFLQKPSYLYLPKKKMSPFSTSGFYKESSALTEPKDRQEAISC